MPHSYDLGELGRYYGKYRELMEHWEKVLPEGALTTVLYEDVVADTEKEARRLIEFLGLKWNEKCLDFHKSDRPVKTASVAQVRKPIYKTAVKRWKKYGDGPAAVGRRIEGQAESGGQRRPRPRRRQGERLTVRAAARVLRRARAPKRDQDQDVRALTHLDRLEAESIHILRETVAEADKPVMLYSIGKDSAVMLHLAKKAFFPSPLPFPLLHVDTTWKFRDMYALRDKVGAEPGDRAHRLQEPGSAERGASTRSTTGRCTPTCGRPKGSSRRSTNMASTPRSAAPGATRRRAAPRSACSASATATTAGTRSASGPSCGRSTMSARARARASASSRCPTGPSSTCGNISCARRSRSCRSISRPSGRRSSATA